MSDLERHGRTTAEARYLELTALLIDREISRFRRGEQAALVSFSNVAKLARIASQELGVREHAGRPNRSLTRNRVSIRSAALGITDRD